MSTETEKTTVKKAPARKPAPKKKTASLAEKAQAAVIKQNQFDPNDMIPCMSLYPGRMVREGARSRVVYIWDKLGTIENVSYEDLRTWMNSNNNETIYGPDLFICVPEVYENNTKLKRIYEELIDPDDIGKILTSRDFDRIKILVETSNPTRLGMIKTIIRDMIDSEDLSDMTTIRLLDDLMKTNYALLMQ